MRLRHPPTRSLLTISLSLLLAGAPLAEAARLVTPAPAPSAAHAVSPVPGGALGNLSAPADLVSSVLSSPLSLSGVLPGAVPAAANTPAAKDASPTQAARAPARDEKSSAEPLAGARSAGAEAPAQAPSSSGRASANRELKTAGEALDGERAASRIKPGLARLGSRLSAPAADDSLDDQSASADRYFRQKAGLEDDAGEDLLFEAFSPESAKPKTGAADAGPSPDPVYPARNIRFGGATFPSVAFRPDRPIEPLIVQAIDASKKSIAITVYEFKSREILHALRRAKARGVEITVIVDAGYANPVKREGSDYWPHRSFELQALINGGFNVRVLRGQWRYGIMHNKIGIFDGKMALFGSYNWSYTSERNHFENVVFTTVKSRVTGLQKLFTHLDKHAVDFKDALQNPWPEEVPPVPKDETRPIGFNGLKLPGWVFTPDPEAEDWVARTLDAAKTSIEMSMFTFTSPRIARALVAAKKRGVKVRVILDKSQSGQPFMEPFMQFLAFHRIETKILAGPNPDGPQWAEKDHNKFTLVDGKLALTGSLNYTKSGFLTNFENMFFINEKADVAAFALYFKDMFESRLAETAVPPTTEPELPTEEDIVDGLRGPPLPVPPPPAWPDMPQTRTLHFNGETFASSIVRPQHPVRDILVKAIDGTKKTLRLALYEFDLPEVLDALRRAKKRGVDVRIIFDYSHVFPKGQNTRGEDRDASDEIQALMKEGFDITVLRGVKAQGIMHNKIGIFDFKMVTFGSYNWALTAEFFHFETVKFETDKDRVDYYVKLWDWMRSYSVRVKDAEEHNWNKAWKDGRQEGRTTPMDPAALQFNGARFPKSAASPAGMVEDTLVRAIRAAKASIDIAMFSFYSARIAEELLRAKERGVHVRIAFDRAQSKLMKLDDWFAYYGFDVRVVPGPNPYGNVFFEKNHNKFMILDGKMLEMGSFNFTGNAEENSFENVNFYLDQMELAFFRAYFEMLFGAGWRPIKPESPPEGLPTPAQFFNPERMRRLAEEHGFEF